ncbi:FAD-binding monooxygenase [Moraxellaceae bacterium AER2_44_116]|nr:FAD-dependent monooxygenase [Moraxellaceae bacterium]TQC97457.1 FAD-binding monooxygenase [Moraxellaceae bacterium AER2_44_116]
MRILIAGAGIGGLTAALTLLNKGFDVAIYERSLQLEEVGAGIQIGPNGTKVLYALGLGAALAQAAFKPQAAEMRLGDSGRVIFSLPLGESIEKRYHSPYLNIHRADLHRILVDAVRQKSPNAIHLGYEVKELHQTDARVTLHFLNGESAQGDVLVGADGVRSVIRKELFDIEDGQFTGMAAWRMTIPTHRLPKNLVPPNATVWVGAGKHVVTYYLRGGELVNLVGVVEQVDWPYDGWTCRGNKHDILASYEGWHPTIRQIMEAGDETEYYQWALRELPPLATWSKGRATLLGDACHAMLPFMAQGAVMAIEDAWVLAAKLAAYPQDIAKALQQYEGTRKPRTTKVQATARRNGQLYHQTTPSKQLLFYSPLWLVSRLTPNFFASQLDWLFAEDVTRIS